MRNLSQAAPANNHPTLADARRLFGVSLDAPLPAQRATPPLPELRLLAALLDDAINILLGGRARPALVYETFWWIRTGTRGRVSFDDCCLWLGLNPEVTRRVLLARACMPGRNEHNHARSRAECGPERN